MPTTPRTRRLTRVLTAGALASVFIVGAGAASTAGTTPEPTAAAAGEVQTSAPTASLVEQEPADPPKLTYDESRIPESLRMLADEQWYEGGTDMGWTVDCAFGTPAMLGRSWVGWYGSWGSTPTTDQARYYTKIGWGVSGGCGGAYVHVEEFLPAGSQLAITQEHPVMCWYEGLDADDEMRRFGANEGCPAQPGNGMKGGLSFDPNDGSGAWPTAIGAYFEIWVPIKTPQPLSGGGGNPCQSCVSAALWFIDGNQAPWGYPQVPVLVNGTAPTTPYVSYPAPSLRNPGCCPNGQATGEIVSWIFTQRQPGTTQFQIDDEPGAPYDLFRQNGTITASDITALGPDIEQYLPLVFDPDTQYYWRLCFTPTGSTQQYCGVEQTFNVASPPDDTPPQTTIDSKPPANAGTRNASFEFSSSKPFSTFRCRIDGGDWEGCIPGMTYSDLADGEHVFDVKAVSQSDVEDSTPASYTWTVNPPPNTTITSGPPAKTSKRTATFTFTATEATKRFQCKLDTNRWKDCSSGSVTYSQLSRTKHTFAVKATDLLGKVDPTPAKRSWTITR